MNMDELLVEWVEGTVREHDFNPAHYSFENSDVYEVALLLWRDINPFRLWRHERGLSVPVVAQQSGLSRFSLSSYERGRRSPSDDMLREIEAKTGIENLFEDWREWEATCPLPESMKG